MFYFNDDYESVVAELKSRGLWEVANSTALPNRTIGCPKRRELFYVQDSPRLAAWARYDNDNDYDETYFNVTARRVITSEVTCESEVGK